MRTEKEIHEMLEDLKAFKATDEYLCDEYCQITINHKIDALKWVLGELTRI